MAAMNSKLKNSFLPLIIIGLTIVACIYYWASLVESQKAEMDVAKHRGELHVQQINEAVDQQLDATIRSVDTAIRHLRSVYLHDRKNLEHSVHEMLDAYPKGMLQFVIVIGADGFLNYSSDTKPNAKSSHVYFGDREHFQVHADSNEDRLFISEPIVGRISGIPLIQCTRAIRDGKRFVGVIGVPLRPEYISNNLWTLHIDPSDMISIVREDGRIIARSRNLEEGLKLTTPASRPFMHSQAGEHGIFRDISITDKKPLLFSWRHLTNYPIIAVAAIDEETELKVITSQQAEAKNRTLVAMVVIIVFTLLISILIIRDKRKNAGLSQNESRLRTLITNAPNGMIIIDPTNGRVVQANQIALNMWGYSADEILTKTTSDITYPDDIAESNERNRRLAKGEADILRFEKRYLRRDGRYFWGETCVSTLKDATGKVNLFIGSTIDIDQRKKAELSLKNESEKNSAFLRNASDGVHILDIDGNIIEASESFCMMLGYRRDEIIGMNVSQWDAKFVGLELVEVVRQLFAVQGHSQFETLHRRKDGTLINVEVSSLPHVLNDSPVLFCSSRDITLRNLLEQELRKYKAIVDSTDDAVISKSLGGIIDSWNHGAEKMFGYTANDAIGQSIQILIPPEYHEEESKLLEKVAHGESIEQYETVRRHKNGHLISVSLTISPILDDHARVIGATKIARDITEHKKLAAQIHELAFYDPLTKLPNRRMLNDRLTQTMAASKRSGSYCALLFLDLDNFKPLNDAHGHAIGDLLLIEAANRLKGCVREVDTIARLGGDEFVILLSELNADKGNATTEAQIIAEKISFSLSRPYILAARTENNAEAMVEHHCTASIGVCIFNHSSGSQEDILQWADAAMYQAKELGRNRVQLYGSVS